MSQFQVPQLLIREYEFWTWSLRPQMVTLGASVFICKEDVTSLGKASATALAELGMVSADLERITQRLFQAEKYNYLFLMMVDPELHCHALPRYSRPVSLLGQVFHDICWPKPVDLQANLDHSAINAILPDLVIQMRTAL